MVIHITIDGYKTEKNIQLLYEYLKKDYKVQVVDKPIDHDGLLLHETLLQRAMQRSIIQHHTNNDEYDLVIWNTSSIQDYLDSESLNYQWIQRINQYNNIRPDIQILINKDIPEEKLTKIINNNNQLHIINYTNHQEIHQEIIQILHKNLPHCQWCGRIFTIDKHHKKYCTNDCKKYARQEQNRVHRLKYYHRYKHVLTEQEKGTLGTILLHAHPNTDFDKEYELIQKEKYRTGIH